MTDKQYLNRVLKDQTLEADSDEVKELQDHRKEVEELLQEEYGKVPAIRYAGSYAKRTMIKRSYDLDIACYFPRDDTTAGSTLKEIYESVEAAARTKYWTERKASAIRLRSKDATKLDFHIDLVPGRFVDGNDGDVNLHRTKGDKGYLKTNLDVHIQHIRDSGVREAIRLVKLWAAWNNIPTKTFVLELLVIKLLDGQDLGLPEQLKHVLTQFRDKSDDLSVKDPANPNGNDLSEAIDEVRALLQMFARSTLAQVDAAGEWNGVFGKIEEEAAETDRARMEAVRTVAQAGGASFKPWSV